MSSGKARILTPRPKLAFARAAAWLVPPAPIAHGVHATAVISQSARLGRGGGVGPFAGIGEENENGGETRIGGFCFLGRGGRLCRGCRLDPPVTPLAGVEISNNVISYSGA